ncbi:coiled-coil domain-containing protein [Ewingella americana]|uniref:hypothetical protein n=1 Tax=Ewingella americana TaxID=41202 RepID=UPI00139DADD0|nr:hypothetical protein [Ewingella americana]MRT01919.1 hypothetical protein [Ewingella americana]
MSETTDLTVIEIKPEQAPALYIPNGLDAYLEHIKASVSEAPDLSTKKGRDRVASLAASVSRSKTAIEKPGREYLKRLKEAVKPAEQEIKRFVDACDAIRDATRQPLTEWEAEQERLAAEKQMLDWHVEALELNESFDKERAERFEADHEVALLMNDKFDRDAADAKAEVERLKKEHEERIAKEAVEKARIEAEAAAQREREAALQREADLKAQAAQAESNRIAAEKKAEQDRIDAANKADADRLAAEQRAEREKQEAIAAEQLKAKQKEDARLAEEKRIADEAAARAANVEHKRAINQQAVAELVAAGISEECAVQCVKAIAKGQVSAIHITY